MSALWLFTVTLRLTAGPHTVDDAYITFRYARNLAEGAGLVYNPGERVLGTSAPLFAVALGLAGRVADVDDFPFLAFAVNAIADGFTCVAIVLISERLGLRRWSGLAAASLVALSPLVIRYSIGGMETSLVMLAATFAIYRFLAGDRRTAYHLAGLALLLRPDALALGSGLLIADAFDTGRLPRRGFAVILGWLLTYALALTLVYGLPVPHSVVAKVGPVYSEKPLANFFQFAYLFSGLTPTGVQGFGARVFVVEPSAPLNRVALAFLLPVGWACLIGIRRMIAVTRRSAAILAYAVSLFLTYTFAGLRGSLMAEWYLVGLTPFWSLALAAGLAALQERTRFAMARAAAVAPALLLVGLQVASFNGWRDPTKPPTLPLNVWVEREAQYLVAAEYLKNTLSAREWVAAPEIGALGYACACPILDTVGLVSPAATNFYASAAPSTGGNYSVPPELVLSLRPDYLVSLDVFVRTTLLRDKDFLSTYREAWAIDATAFGSRRLVIYERGASESESVPGASRREDQH